jgi:hypothetical protein
MSYIGKGHDHKGVGNERRFWDSDVDLQVGVGIGYQLSN